MSEKKLVITVSRQYGSGGREIGKRLAEELGFTYYDKELIALAAKESGMGEEFFESNDEKVPNGLAHLFSHVVLAGNGSEDSLPLSDRVFLASSRIIKEVAAKGNCVIVGRCADYILEGECDSIDLYVRADWESRVARCMERNGLDRADAIARIKSIDKRRATYYRYYTDRTWGDVANFNLSINSADCGIEGTVELLKRYVELYQAQ